MEDEYEEIRYKKMCPAEKRRLRNKKAAQKTRIRDKVKMQNLEAFKQSQAAKCEEFLSILMETLKPD